MICIAIKSLLKEWHERQENYSAYTAHYWCYALSMLHIISDEIPFNIEENMKEENFDVFKCGLPDFFEKSYNDNSYIKQTIKNLYDGNESKNGLKNTLQKDKLLQKGLGYLMKVEDFENAIKSGYFNKCFLIKMLTYHLKYKENDICLVRKALQFIFHNFNIT